MGVVDGLSKIRMLAIEAASVVSGSVNGSGDLILTKHDASTINAGNVVGPQGSPGVNAFTAPTGGMIQWPAAAAPTGWLLCQGQELAIATYGDLYAVVGVIYGALTNGSGGVGTTHFRVPNLQGKIPVGLDAGQTEFDALSETGGSKTSTAPHTHTLAGHTHGLGAHTHSTPGSTTGTVSSGHTHNFSTNTDGGHGHTALIGAISGSGTGTSPAEIVGSANNGRVNQTIPNSASGGTHAHGGVTGDINQNHTHSVPGGTSGGPSGGSDGSSVASDGSSAAVASGNLQPYIVLNYIIKT